MLLHTARLKNPRQFDTDHPASGRVSLPATLSKLPTIRFVYIQLLKAFFVDYKVIHGLFINSWPYGNEYYLAAYDGKS
jgi:hypothetical protein